MLFYACSKGCNFIDELRQRSGVAFGELTNAAGEGLRNAIQFALHGGGKCGKPFVIHHEGLDLSFGDTRSSGVIRKNR